MLLSEVRTVSGPLLGAFTTLVLETFVMPKFPKPFYRTDRKLWYLQLGKKQIKLSAEREKAFERYHALMSRPVEVRTSAESLATVIDRFLDWCHKHRAPETYGWYRSRLQLFVERYPDLNVSELRPYHVQEWIDSYDHLSSGSKRNHCRSIQRALHWAEEQGLIERSPIAHLKKPRGGAREVLISPEEYQRILRHCPNEQLRDLLTFAWETGARAAECLAIERRHVDLEHFRIVFPREEEKMRRAPRVIYLSQAAADVIRRRLRLPHNRLFVNCHGRLWTTESVNCAFCAIQHRIGKAIILERGLTISEDEISSFIQTLTPTHTIGGSRVEKSGAALKEEAKRKLTQRLAAKLAPKYCLTAFRHSWCHHALRRGLDALTVSVLMGHSDPSMVARIYSHLSHATDYLHQAANRAVTPTESQSEPGSPIGA